MPKDKIKGHFVGICVNKERIQTPTAFFIEEISNSKLHTVFLSAGLLMRLGESSGREQRAAYGGPLLSPGIRGGCSPLCGSGERGAHPPGRWCGRAPVVLTGDPGEFVGSSPCLPLGMATTLQLCCRHS